MNSTLLVLTLQFLMIMPVIVHDLSITITLDILIHNFF